MYYFTADEHYFHKGKEKIPAIVKYTDRPFKSLEEMHTILIENHNSIVRRKDIIVHGGDFSFAGKQTTLGLIGKLNGTHIFVKGSHDYWSGKSGVFQKGRVQAVGYLYARKFENIYIVVSHYSMRTWPRSHYNSWNLFAHSHGRLASIGKQHDIGVDTEVESTHERFYPYSFDELVEIMKTKEDNFNLVKSE